MDIQIALIDLDFLLRSAQICKKCTIFWQFKDHYSGKRKGNLANDAIFSYTFWALTVRDIIFLFKKCQNLLFWGTLFGPFWSVKYLNFWENMYIKESKEPVSTFSIELRTKFVWSHGNWFQDYIDQKLEVVNENIMRHHRYMKHRVSKVIWSIFFM